MAISTKDFRGQASEGIRIRNAQSSELEAIYQKELPERLRGAGIPVNIHMETVKSGGLFGTKLPMMVISHPNPPSRFFSVGVIVNGNTVSFPLIGESKQNTAKNMGKRYDQFLLQQEISWQSDITHEIKELFDDYFTAE